MSEIKRIVLIGGPGSGKSSVIEQLQTTDQQVFLEISREVIQEARKDGVDQLFLTDPLAFSNKLLAGRIKQHIEAQVGINFYDRGIPDVPAYHRFTGDPIPKEYMDACNKYKYDRVFFFPPWESIYQQDEERYEDFSKAVRIGNIIADVYQELNYDLIQVPFDSLNNRTDFILKNSVD